MRPCCAGRRWPGTAGSTCRRAGRTACPYDDPQVSPIFAADHTDLAPALIIAAGQDPLRDDAHRYADTLRAAGVPAELIDFPDAIHGFLSIPLFEPAAYPALEQISGWLVRTIAE